MNEILSWLGWIVLAMVLLAMLVAGWEHLVREARGRRLDSGVHARRASGATVDVPLDTASAGLLPEPETRAPAKMAGASTGRSTEHAARLAAMTQALARAATPNRATHDSSRWPDTTPGVVGLNQPVLRDREIRGREHSGERSGARTSETGPGQLG